MSQAEELLDALRASLSRAAALTQARVREAKQLETKLRDAQWGAPRKVLEALEPLRSAANDLIATQSRDAERIATEHVSTEKGAERTVAQRFATQWLFWLRGAYSLVAAEWISSHRAIADLSSAQLNETLRSTLQLVVADVAALKALEAELVELERLAAELAAVKPNVIAAPQPRPRSRASWPRRTFPPKK